MSDAPSLAGEAGAQIPFIFAYGGLMRGFDLHHFMASATFVGEGCTSGALIALGRYPGLINGAGEVLGEVYRLSEVAAMLEALDDLEEYDPANPEGSAYLRVVREVRMNDGAVVRAWVYVYNRDARGAPVVAGGDWRRRT